MTKFISTLIIIICSFSCANAQNAQIESTAFKAWSLNGGLSFSAILSANGNWSTVTDVIGTPDNAQICVSNVVEEICTLDYSNLKIQFIQFDGAYRLLDLSITSAQNFIVRNGVEIRVGDSATVKLSNLFPVAWQKRQIRAVDNTTSLVILQVGQSDLFLRFEYNESSNSITKINVNQIF